MAITSSSTQADVLAQFNDNLGWEGNVTKAKAALEAVRWLVINRPESIRFSDGRAMNYAALLDEKNRLEAFVNANDSTVRSRQCSFTRGRMLY